MDLDNVYAVDSYGRQLQRPTELTSAHASARQTSLSDRYQCFSNGPSASRGRQIGLPPPPPLTQAELQKLENSKRHKRHAYPERSSRLKAGPDSTSSRSSEESSSVSSGSSSSSSSSRSGSSVNSSHTSSYSYSSSYESTSSDDRDFSSSSSSIHHRRDSGSKRSASRSSKHSHCHGNHDRSQVVSRRPVKPDTALQDERIAAAAACSAILKKEEEVKAMELKLLQQKRNFIAEVQRRTSATHDFSREEDALLQMQLMVEGERRGLSLLEDLKHRNESYPPSNAPTDAGALEYLRSSDPQFGNTAIARHFNPVVTRPTGSNNITEQLRTPTDGPLSGAIDQQTVKSSATPVSGSANREGGSGEGNCLSPNGPQASEPSSATAAEDAAVAEEAETRAITMDDTETMEEEEAVEEEHVEEQLGPHQVITALTPTAGMRRLRSHGEGKSMEPSGARHSSHSQATTHVMVPQHRVKVRIWRPRTRSHKRTKEQHHGTVAQTKLPTPNASVLTSTVAAPAVSRALLPPPPSPIAAAEPPHQQIISVAPLQHYNTTSQQPWAVVNWPCSVPPPAPVMAAAAASRQRSLSPPALQFAAASAVPISHREFKNLLCSEYVPPVEGPALSPKVDPPTQLDPTTHEPYTMPESLCPAGVESQGGQLEPQRTSDLPQMAAFNEARAAEDLEEIDVSPLGPPPPPLPMNGESVVEFPPRPLGLAPDMPPPSGLSSGRHNSSCCSCWGCLFHCLFPCCCREKKNPAMDRTSTDMEVQRRRALETSEPIRQATAAPGP